MRRQRRQEGEKGGLETRSLEEHEAPEKKGWAETIHFWRGGDVAWQRACGWKEGERQHKL